MNDQLKKEVELKILQFIKGQTLERNKLEFKRQWYDLSWTKKPGEGKELRNKDYYEFLKDCTSIINSYGRDDGFIVIGIDEESKALKDTTIQDSKLNDSSKIKDVIIGNVDKAFLIDIDYLHIEGKQLSIIHIPPSTDKPHLIAEYWSKNLHKSENVIWIKNGSGASIATRGDLDRMYWERSNIVLDKKIESAIKVKSIKFDNYTGQNVFITLTASFENVGTRKVLVSGFELEVKHNSEKYTFIDVASRPDGLLLEPNAPTLYSVRLSAFINLNQSKREQLLSTLNEFKANLEFTFLFQLSNHQKLLSIPILENVSS